MFINSRHYHYECVYEISERFIYDSFSYFELLRSQHYIRREAAGGRLQHETILSPDPSDTEDIIKLD